LKVIVHIKQFSGPVRLSGEPRKGRKVCFKMCTLAQTNNVSTNEENARAMAIKSIKLIEINGEKVLSRQL